MDAPSQLHVLLVGDSDIARWPTTLLPKHTVSISGHSGATLGESWPHVVKELDAIEATGSVSWIIFCAGENDMLEGILLEKGCEELTRLVDVVNAEKRDCRLIFLGPKLEPWIDQDRESRKQYYQMSQAFQNICESHPGASKIYYVDCLVMFCGRSGRQRGAVLGGKAHPDSSFFDSDGLHLSHKGYQKWKEVVEEIMQCNS